MSNETENRKETVLDMLEDQAQHFADFVKSGWEHAMKSCGEKGIDLPTAFKHYHRAMTATFAHTVIDPNKMMTLVLGAVSRELINSMDEAQKAELACITLEELDYSHKRNEDGSKEED